MASKDTPPEIAEEFGDSIETLFKVTGPFTRADFGYMGVLLRSEDDKIHCHLCGKWFKLLGTHINKSKLPGHGMDSATYRLKYGLPLTFPLCSRTMSAMHSEVSSRPEQLARLRKLGNKYRPSGKKLSLKLKRSMKYTLNNEAHQNKHNSCAAQMYTRYLAVCDIVGKTASQRDLIKYDDALRGHIYRKYKTINAFRAKHKFTTVARAEITTEVKVIAQLRKFRMLTGRVPRPGDFVHAPAGGFTTQAIRRRMGSWHRALLMAGFSPDQQEPKSHSLFRKLA